MKEHLNDLLYKCFTVDGNGNIALRMTIQTGGLGSWKDPVANFASLPGSGNVAGDTRITLDTYTIYSWNGTGWQVSGGGGSVTAGNGIAVSGSTVSVDLATSSGLQFVTGKLAVKVDGTTIENTAGTLNVKSGVYSLVGHTHVASDITDLTSALNTWLATKTTDNVSQWATNKYYASSLFNTDFASKTTDNLTEGVTNLYYTSARFNTAFGTKTTDNLTEGTTNLYFTTARARTASVVDSLAGTQTDQAPSVASVNTNFANYALLAGATFTGLLKVTIAGSPMTLTNPNIQATNSVNNFTQIANTNKSNGANASADFIAYPDNNTDDATGFVDIGVTSSGFAQASYAITTPNDAYLFASAVSGAGKLGNLVIATDSTGSSNSIIFGVNGFTSLNKERARIDGATGAFSYGYASVANGINKYYNSTNANTVTIQSGVTGTSYTLTLPTSAPGADWYALVSTTGGILSWASAGGVSWGSSITGTSGNGLTLTMDNSYGASGIAFKGVINNTQTQALKLIDLDTGTAGRAHVLINGLVQSDGANARGIQLKGVAGLTTNVNFIDIDTVSTTSTGSGTLYGININVANNTKSAGGIVITNANSGGLTDVQNLTGNNAGVASVYTRLTTGKRGFVWEIAWSAGGATTNQRMYSVGFADTQNTGAIGFYSLATNTQSNAIVHFQADLGTSAVGHTGFLINMTNASSSAYGISIQQSTTGTGTALYVSWTATSALRNHLVLINWPEITASTSSNKSIFRVQHGNWFEASLYRCIDFWANISAHPIGDGSKAWLYINDAGSSYMNGIIVYTQTSNTNKGIYGWTKTFSARTTDANQIYYQRQKTSGATTETDTFSVFNFKRESIINISGGTLNAQGSIVSITNVSTQTLGTLTDTVDLLQITQNSSSTWNPISITQNAVVSTNYRRLIKETATGITIWMGNGTTANGTLSGTAGDILLNGGSNKPEYCTGTTTWVALV